MMSKNEWMGYGLIPDNRYDNNQITCDGSVDMVNNEDINAKMRACGFDVLEVEDVLKGSDLCLERHTCGNGPFWRHQKTLEQMPSHVRDRLRIGRDAEHSRLAVGGVQNSELT